MEHIDIFDRIEALAASHRVVTLIVNERKVPAGHDRSGAYERQIERLAAADELFAVKHDPAARYELSLPEGYRGE